MNNIIIFLLLISDLDDFIAMNHTFDFPPFKTEVCSPFEIVDDKIALEGNETFIVMITSVSPGANIGVNTSYITICDDDSQLLIDVDVINS